MCEKYSNEKRGVNIDQSAVCCISMDSSRQAIQTKRIFLNFGIICRIYYNFLKIQITFLTEKEALM